METLIKILISIILTFLALAIPNLILFYIEERIIKNKDDGKPYPWHKKNRTSRFTKRVIDLKK